MALEFEIVVMWGIAGLILLGCAILELIQRYYKLKVWKEKKKMGVRCRKPRRISAIFNQKYYKALKLK